MFKCEICLIEFKSIKSLISHTSQTHKIKSKDYYDKYLRNVDEGICYCGANTKYKNANFGYHKFCSTKCQSNDSEIKKRSLKTKGKNHWTVRIGGPNKGKTYEEIHGEYKAIELKKNLSEQGKKLIGDKNPFYNRHHTEENKEILRNYRINKTYEEIYGYEKAKEEKKKRMKDNLDKTGWRDYWSAYPLNFYDGVMRFRVLMDQFFICPICFKSISKKFSKNLHHINYVKKDNRRRNFIYLCVSCHGTTNRNRGDWKKYLKKINNLIINKQKYSRRLAGHIDKGMPLPFREILINKRRILHYE